MSRKKTQGFLEVCALALVILLPIIAIGWYFLYGNNIASAPATVATSIQASAGTQAAPAQQPAAAATGAVTLDDAAALPQTVATGQVVPFSFAIKNTGLSAAAFPYKVYVKWNSGEEDVIDENSVTLAAGASTDITEALKFETAGAKGEVYIILQPAIDTIHFAMPRA